MGTAMQVESLEMLVVHPLLHQIPVKENVDLKQKREKFLPSWQLIWMKILMMKKKFKLKKENPRREINRELSQGKKTQIRKQIKKMCMKQVKKAKYHQKKRNLMTDWM